MDDRRLSEMLRMAAEAERMEFGDIPLGRSHSGLNLGHGWRLWSALAAGVAIVGTLGIMGNSMMQSGQTSSGQGQSGVGKGGFAQGGGPTRSTVTVPDIAITSATSSDSSSPQLPAHDVSSVALVRQDDCLDESTVLLALFKRADGATSSVRLAMKDWDNGRGLNDLGEGELIGFAFENQDDVSPETLPNQVVLVSVTGPSELIPSIEAGFSQLASCLMGTPSACGDKAACYADAAIQCLPQGVTVLSETRAMW